MKKIFTVLAVIMIMVTTYGQTDSVRTLIDEGVRLCDQGQYQQSIHRFPLLPQHIVQSVQQETWEVHHRQDPRQELGEFVLCLGTFACLEVSGSEVVANR